MNEPKIIAFYLPQYHPTPDNDKWWGKGFTEWTNVGKAKPLFRGHYQPKVPADLGYYDLRLPEVREAQAELAKDAGIYGFCYYHYWFGNGKEELELPFNEVLRLGKPNFPFMLCWANESWHQKFWDKDCIGVSKKNLIEQTYPGEEDIVNHFYRLLPAFKDPRYIRIEGKPAYMIYKPHLLPEAKDFIKRWNDLAIENGLEGITFIAHVQSETEQKMTEENFVSLYLSQNFNFINIVRLYKPLESCTKWEKFLLRIKRMGKFPLIYPYLKAIKYFVSDIDTRYEIFPTIIPNWDHTPRSGINGLIYSKATPANFGKHLRDVFEINKNKITDNNFIFLKSWNEWGEGNYIEPDLKYGHGYLDTLRLKLKDI